MARSQKDLDDILLELLGEGVHRYFQPPPSLQIKYPCVVYEISSGNSQYADNHLYIYENRYTLTYLTRHANDSNNEKIQTLQKCRFDRRYCSNGLYHNVYDLYF